MTLVEQIMVLAIAAILTGLALPSLRQLLSRNRLQTAQIDFISALQNARFTAASTGKQTLFCPSEDGRQCSNTTRWDSGWLLSHDTDGDHQPDGTPSYTGAAYASGMRITSSTGRRDVRFRPDGSARGSNLTLAFCQLGSSEPALTVVVSNSGRVRGAPANAAQTERCMRTH
ncbi:MAG TPA: GspH/FimT family pseudopilin [Acidobacteriaceae bacterium]|nr:GspH/FimT family pseudopilin [Acidobacteriaceae bacterium]